MTPASNDNGSASFGARADPIELGRLHPLDTHDYIRPILRRWWVVLGVVIVVTGATYAYYSRQPKVYQATTQILIQQTSSAVTAVLGSPGIDATRLDADAANLIRTPAVAILAARGFGYGGNPAALLGAISVSSDPNTDFLLLSARASSGQLAANIANGFAAAYVKLQAATAAASARNAAALTQKQINQLSGPDRGTTLTQLTQQLSQLQILARYPQSGVQQVNPAAAASIPVSPQPKKNAEFAAAISLLAAILLCFALERIDRRIKRIDELEILLGAPVLAAVPHSTSAAASSEDRATIDPDIAEPFRMLRAVVRLAAGGEDVKTVLVTSGLAAEGKSTVARNLGLAYCETGSSVLVVDCDLRGPMMDRILGGEVRELGLTDVLAGLATVDESIIEIPIDVSEPGTVALDQRGHRNGNHKERQTIGIMPAGSARANPATLVETVQFRELFDSLRTRYDIVIIDSAPILPVSDSLPLVGMVDGVLIVARDGVLTRGAASRLSELIAQAQPKLLLGIVANDFPAHELGSYGMSYYGDSYGYAGRVHRRKVRAAADG
jgi:Mrp family chromosome partitioning ATPase